MSKKTHTNCFSRKEIEILSRNPYVAMVSASTIRFTEEFKQLAYKAKLEGVSITKTLRDHGIDPDILGYSRIAGFSYCLNRKASEENGFADGRKANYRRPPRTGQETVEQRFRLLENELAYTRQEVEFLKKLQAANMEAQKQWESKHRR